MRRKLVLLGDVNLLGIPDTARPFAAVSDRLAQAGVVFANLECCLFDPPADRAPQQEGFYAGTAAGRHLGAASIRVVGTANNVNFGRLAIEGSLDELDRLGISHTGSGRGAEAALAPARVEHDGLRLGFMQRTSVYWPNEHEAHGTETGVAVLKGHTAYSPVLEFNGLATRPGVPAKVVTWADPEYLQRHTTEVAVARKESDFLVCSNHWGYREDVLEYQRQYARASIDAGADLVFGHGPHHPQPIEIYDGKPIFYCVGSFFFKHGHRGRVHGDWIGLAVTVSFEDRQVERISFCFVRPGEGTSRFRRAEDESEMFAQLAEQSFKSYGTRFEVEDGEVVVWKRPA